MTNAQTRALGLAAVAGLVAVPAVQGQTEPAPVNTGKVSWTLGVDAATQYWFRGLAQENQGIILQPYADVTFGLLGEGDYTLDAYLGTWNSLHYDNPTSEGDSDAWYEADFFAGVAIGLPYDLALDISYLNLYSPAGGDIFAEEIDIALAYDDSGKWDGLGLEGFALHPYALLAFEFDGGSDAGDNEGTYLELGVEPTFEIIQSAEYPVSLAIPVTVGLGLEDYYETRDGDDDTLGFVDVGAVVSVPLPFIPNDYGAWSASAGVHWIFLGDSAQDIAGPGEFNVTGGDDNYVYATLGISMSY